MYNYTICTLVNKFSACIGFTYGGRGFTSPCVYTVVLLTEVEHLTKNAQHALRRTMEKYTASCRLILSCTSTSKVIPAIRSRCLGVRVAAPTTEEVCVCVRDMWALFKASGCLVQISTVLQQVCKKERLTLPAELALQMAQKSKRNLRKALLICEACRVQQ